MFVVVFCQAGDATTVSTQLMVRRDCRVIG
jgi:hypothetical protein